MTTQRPDPPLAEVRVAEEEGFLNRRGEVEEIYLGHAGPGDAELAGGP